MYITQNKHKKLKPGLVASCDIRPGKGEGLFWFWHFINLSLTYLDTDPLTYRPGLKWGSCTWELTILQCCVSSYNDSEELVIVWSNPRDVGWLIKLRFNVPFDTK